MPRRETPLIAGKYYHIYNRGHNRQSIVRDQADYGLFLRKFRQFVTPKHGAVIAYVLMPNHYHVLLRAASDDLSHAMQLFGISYAKIFNRQMERVGSVFQGAFQAKAVEDDSYLLQLTDYLHANPVRARLAARAGDWPYSSYSDYVGERSGTLPEPAIIYALLAKRAGFEVRSQVAPTELYRQHFLANSERDPAPIRPLLFD